MPREDLLFSNSDLRTVLDAHRNKALKAVDMLVVSDISAEAEERTLAQLEKDYIVVPLELGVEASVGQTEVEVDVSRDPYLSIEDRSRPFFVKRQLISYFVPYHGDKQLWYCKPNASTYSTPVAKVDEGNVIFEFAVTIADIPKTKNQYNQALANLKQWISWVNADVETFNKQISGVLRNALRQKREKLEKTVQEVQALGLPIRKSQNKYPKLISDAPEPIRPLSRYVTSIAPSTQQQNQSTFASNDPLRKLDKQIEQIELEIRKVINVVLESDCSLIPSHVLKKPNDRIQDAIKKNPAFDEERYQTLPGKLEYFDIRELQDTISNRSLWNKFKPLFGNKETLIKKFEQLAELRHPIRHSRPVDDVIQKEGEAAILWFKKVLAKKK